MFTPCCQSNLRPVIPAAHFCQRRRSHKVRKRREYSALSERIDFRPVGLETLEPFSLLATDVFDRIVSRIRSKTGDLGARIRLYRRIAAAVQIGNAACLLMGLQ